MTDTKKAGPGMSRQISQPKQIQDTLKEDLKCYGSTFVESLFQRPPDPSSNELFLTRIAQRDVKIVADVVDDEPGMQCRAAMV
jgi:hypothetical protein